jgi:phosphate transport system substrate-binding protein
MPASRSWKLCAIAVSCCALSSCDVLSGVDIQGAGATFPAPLYKRWFLEYYHRHPDVRAAALKEVLNFCLTEGQQWSQELGYIPLPTDIAERAQKAAQRIKP